MIERRAAPGLAWALTVRLATTMIVVMVLQAGAVAVRDYLNETDFLNSYVRRESLHIARAIADHHSAAGKSAPLALPSQYTGPFKDDYAFRAVESDGRIIAEHNSARLTPLSPWSDRPLQRQDFWVRKLDTPARMHVVGGIKVRQPSGQIWVEIATFGDPQGTYLPNLLRDILDDVWVPALPLISLSMLVAWTSVRGSLRPLIKAASRADEISALEKGERLDVSELPAEARHFASAINRLLDRVADLVSAQRLFIARAAHELRTPLSIMMLELAHVKDPSGKRLEADLEGMSEIVERLLLLSRLQTIEKPSMQPVELSTLGRELVTRMLAWAETHGHSLSFESHSAPVVLGDEMSLRDAIRNLIENAVKHTPAGTRIHVAIADDGAIVVEDTGPGLGALSHEELQQPFRKGSEQSSGAGLGLAIVSQTVALHGGKLEMGTSPTLGGARFVVRIPPARNVPLAA